MDFNANKKSISALFTCKKQFVIPRFQREYSWGRMELDEFLDDLLTRICVHDDKPDTDEYFWGSLLLVGDLEDQNKQQIEVVDGQQRITTMTIFLSVIAKMFSINKKQDLADALWEYIVGKDVNMGKFAVLVNETPKPFFQLTVQQLEEGKQAPKTTEEEKILFANKFFKQNLSQRGLINRLKKLNKEELIKFDYVELLKVIRDQLLRSCVICISTVDNEYANMIFEILNAKGRELVSVDLIKNTIFEKLNEEVPVDKAKVIWKNIRDNLCSRNQRIEVTSFYRHFWTACYGKTLDRNLYRDFSKKVGKTQEDYLKFLELMERMSNLYVMILKPDLEIDFCNRKEKEFIITELETLNETFGIVQVRPLLLSLFYNVKNNDFISNRNLKKLLIGLTSFHYIYNAICSLRPSRLESLLNTAACSLFNMKTKEEYKDIIKKLKDGLVELIPMKEVFIDKFVKLTYTKESISTNVITKYSVNRWQSIISQSDTFLPDSSIEHIINEDSTFNETLNIGNLLLLELKINNAIPEGISLKEKIKFYKDSKYEIVDEFIKEYADNTEEFNIDKRGRDWADKYYDKLKQSIEEII